jgi:hypothetical protein
MGMGRDPETWPPVPEPPAYVVVAIEEWLRAKRNSRRPLTVAAPLLAIFCMLHERKHPVPTRARLASALGTSEDTVDAARSTALGAGEIKEIQETYAGQVARRFSIRRRRFVIPSRELFDLYRSEVQLRRAKRA